MKEPKVAVVILNFNGKHFLQQFLKEVVEFSHPHEVIVADNASTDGSIAYLKEVHPHVRLIQNERNEGYAKGYNDVLKQINADYFVLLNNDVEVTQNWLEPLITLMLANPKIAACQPKLVDQKNKAKFEYAGAAGGFVDKHFYPFCRGRIFNELEFDTGQYNSETPIFWASGACLAINAKLFEEVGGLDEDFFAHMEEIDLCWRLKNYGYQIYYQPKSTVYHVGGGTLQKTNANKTFLNFRNNLISLTKNHPSKTLFFLLFTRLVLDSLAFFKFLLSGQVFHSIAIFRAHFAYYWVLPQTLKKRKLLKQNSKYKFTLSNSYKGSILLDYYLKGLKKFTDLKGGFNN